jgi:hypothetical protein
MSKKYFCFMVFERLTLGLVRRNILRAVNNLYFNEQGITCEVSGICWKCFPKEKITEHDLVAAFDDLENFFEQIGSM